MVAAGEAEGEVGRVLQPNGSQAKEVSTTDAQQLGGGVRVQVAAVESVERLVEERQGEAFGELMFFKQPVSPGVARRARLFVGLRYAPASSKPGPAGERIPALLRGQATQSHFVPPAVSFCSRPNKENSVAALISTLGKLVDRTESPTPLRSPSAEPARRSFRLG